MDAQLHPTESQQMQQMHQIQQMQNMQYVTPGNFATTESPESSPMSSPITPVIIKSMNTIDFVFQPSNLITILLFFILYLLCFLLLKNANDANYTFSRTVDVVVFFMIFAVLLFFYFFISSEEKYSILKAIALEFFRMLDNPFSVIPVFFSLFVFYLFIFFFNIQSMDSENSIVIVSTETILLILLVLMIIVNFFKLVMHIDAIYQVKEMFMEGNRNLFEAFEGIQGFEINP